MLRELRISNFRLFDDEVTVRFRPITVFIGRNNSGKSSIMKFLLMLQQSLEAYGRPDSLIIFGLDREGSSGHGTDKNSITAKQALRFTLTADNSGSLKYGLRSYLESRDKAFEEEQLLYDTRAVIPYRGVARHEPEPEHEARLLMGSDVLLEINRLFPPEARGGRLLEFENAAQTGRYDDKEWLAQKDMAEVLRHNISTLQYLQAGRAKSEFVVEGLAPPSGDVRQDGIYTLRHLRRFIEAADSSNYEFILPHIQAVAGIKKIEFDGPQGSLAWCFATDKVTGATSHMANFGFGVSQCLPIFVQGAIMPRYACLMIEEPEAQLHPTAQLDMGSFFADLWKQRQVGSIIETHSDNILLRLRRLIAEKELSTDDVSVAYFTNDEKNRNMPTIRNLDIDEDGSMQAGLPMEFFGENLKEVLKMGAR